MCLFTLTCGDNFVWFNAVSVRSRKNSLKLIELSSINKVSLV